MAYNNGWYSKVDASDAHELLQMLHGLKTGVEMQLELQKKIVGKVSDRVYEMSKNSPSEAKSRAARIRLSDECERRDRLERRIRIIDDLVQGIKNTEKR